MGVTFVLHVGVRKTGTTYIQSRLERSRAALRADGILYPRLFTESGGGHHNLGRLIRGDDLVHRRRMSFARMSPERRMEVLRASRAPVVILSSETLFPLQKESAARLRSGIPDGRPVVVVAFIRRRSDLVFSKWKSEVKWGPRPPLSTALEQALRPGNRLPSYVPTLRRIEAVFGEDSLRVVHYDGMLETHTDAVESLFSAARLDLPRYLGGREDDVDANISCSIHEAELMRLVHTHREMNAIQLPRQNMLVALERLRHMESRPLDEALAVIERQGSTPTPLGWIDESYQAEDERLIAWLGERILQRPAGPGLFDPRSDEHAIGVPPPDLISRPAVLDAVGAVEEELRA